METSGVHEPIQRGEREDLAARGHDQASHVLRAHTTAPSIDACRDLERRGAGSLAFGAHFGEPQQRCHVVAGRPVVVGQLRFR